MITIFIDTDILIDHSKDKTNLLLLLLKKQENKEVELFINPAVIAEFVTDDNLKDRTKLKQVEDFLKLFTVINLDSKIGFITGEIRRSKKIEYLGDALIAATCLIHNLQLLTRNIKHFKTIKGLEFYHKVL